MKALLLAVLLLSVSCVKPHWKNQIPAPGQGWLDLRPPMQLRVENAYYREGASKRGLDGYLGTEVAYYQVQPNGHLRLLSTRLMKDRPRDQPPVDRLMPQSMRRYRYHRFYFAIVFKRNAAGRGSVLLGANQTAELERLSAELLTDPDAVCNDRSTHCTVFPEDCSVAIELNGEPVRLGPKPGERVPLN
jgi:hypothetical protein